MDFQDIIPHPGEVCGSPAAHETRKGGQVPEDLLPGPFRLIVMVSEGHGHRDVRLCEEGHDRFPSGFLRGDNDIAGEYGKMGTFCFQYVADYPFCCGTLFRLTARPVDIGELGDSEFPGGIIMKGDRLRRALFRVAGHLSALAACQPREGRENQNE